MAEPTVKTIAFFGTCLANSTKVLASHSISSPFVLTEIKASFALNTNRLLKLSFFISPDETEQTTGEPTGLNLLGEYGQVDYITGDDESKFLKHNASQPTHPTWLKVYAVNIDDFNHTIDVQMTIELINRE